MQIFEDPRTVSGYQIELFEAPSDQVIADDPLGRYALLASLQDTLLSLGAGARTLVSGRIGRTPVLEFQITPGRVTDMLETDDHQITMIFESRLTVGERKPAILRFDFPWPQSSVDASGACSGRVRMTLVYAPPLGPAFGAEFARVNLEASLLQRQPKIKKTDRKPRAFSVKTESPKMLYPFDFDPVLIRKPPTLFGNRL